MSGRDAQDDLPVVGDRILLVSRRKAERHGRARGAVTTLHENTELLALTGKPSVGFRCEANRGR